MIQDIPAGIISADGHVCEPPNCYVDYIEPKYKDVAPRIVEQPDGKDAFVVHGMKRPVPLGEKYMNTFPRVVLLYIICY